MARSQETRQGSVASLWRYPVKSMLGEELSAADMTERGIAGDRAYALVDPESGRVISAKNPRKWGKLFDFRASFVEAPDLSGTLSAARITFPDGTTATTVESDIEERLSAQLGRPVRLTTSVPTAPRAEGYWPEYEWLEQPGEVFEFDLPPGTFFDGALVHFLTTATLDRLRSLSPQSRFEVPRFRPNFVIQKSAGVEGFVENDWIDRTLALGDQVRLRVTQPCPRCVMTTLRQGDLPKDPDILRTAVQQNQGNVGVYASVIRGGSVRRGDSVSLA
ncbi:MAG: MOSC domain-containing protein [Isosphaerales bacterium]